MAIPVKHILTLFTALLLAPLPVLRAAEGIKISADSFTLSFTAEGRPESCVRKSDGVEFLPRGRGGEGFFLKGVDGAMVRLSSMSLLPDGHLLVANAEGSKKVRFAVMRGQWHLAFRIESAEGIAPEQFESFHFSALSNPQLRVLSLGPKCQAPSAPDDLFLKPPTGPRRHHAFRI